MNNKSERKGDMICNVGLSPGGKDIKYNIKNKEIQ